MSAAPRFDHGADAAPVSAVACRGVSKDFEAGGAMIRVLHDIDFDVPAGELTMLVGPSGCGKTTLISIIAGILSATAGTVTLFGQPMDRLSSSGRVAFRRQNIGFIFQQYNLLPALTAAENAAIPLVAAGMKMSEAARRAADLLERIGLKGHTRKLPKQLSGGQQQRVAIARALVHEPRLIICDEPTAALDAASGHAIMEILRETAVHPERAVIIVTHDNRIFGFADRIASMEDGRIIRIATQTAQIPQAHEGAHA